MSSVTTYSVQYDRIYETDDFFKDKSHTLGQYMVVDTGCPRALLGHKELEVLMKSMDIKLRSIKGERFRFGPSRVYTSKRKATLSMKVGDTEIDFDFFVIEGDVPILLGNDVLVPLGGKVDLGLKQLVLKELGITIPLVRTPGHHYVIPVKSMGLAKNSFASKDSNDTMENINVKGPEAESVMLILLANIETNEEIENLHQQLGIGFLMKGDG